MSLDSPDSDAQSPTRIGELILAAREGSDEALGQLMQFSRQYLLLIANDQLPAELQAKGGASDLVQETQLEALRAFKAFRGRTASELLGWLREILLHNVRDFTRRFTGAANRRVSREVPLYESEEGPSPAARIATAEGSPSSHVRHAEQLHNVEIAIRQLPEDYRQVVLWHHRDGYTFEQISTRLGRSVGAVRKLWARAIQQLQTQLRSDHE